MSNWSRVRGFGFSAGAWVGAGAGAGAGAGGPSAARPGIARTRARSAESERDRRRRTSPILHALPESNGPPGFRPGAPEAPSVGLVLDADAEAVHERDRVGPLLAVLEGEGDPEAVELVVLAVHLRRDVREGRAQGHFLLREGG